MPRSRRVLVAGGTSGIGAAIVTRLCRCGDRVLFTGRDVERGRSLTATTGAAFAHCVDMDANAIDRLLHQTRQRLGGIDGLVIAIGARPVARLSETTDETWDAVLDANLTAAFLLARDSLALFGEQGGAIVTIASTTAQWPDVELGAYSVSKRALEHLSRMLAVEGATKNIRVNCVLPGEAAAASATVAGHPVRDSGEAPIPPLGRSIRPEDVAAAVDFFLGAEAAFCAGASLVIDGGLGAALRASQVRQ